MDERVNNPTPAQELAKAIDEHIQLIKDSLDAYGMMCYCGKMNPENHPCSLCEVEMFLDSIQSLLSRQSVEFDAQEQIDAIMNQRDGSKTEGIRMSKKAFEELKSNKSVDVEGFCKEYFGDNLSDEVSK